MKSPLKGGPHPMLTLLLAALQMKVSKISHKSKLVEAYLDNCHYFQISERPAMSPWGGHA